MTNILGHLNYSDELMSANYDNCKEDALLEVDTLAHTLYIPEVEDRKEASLVKVGIQKKYSEPGVTYAGEGVAMGCNYQLFC